MEFPTESHIQTTGKEKFSRRHFQICTRNYPHWEHSMGFWVNPGNCYWIEAKGTRPRRVLGRMGRREPQTRGRHGGAILKTWPTNYMVKIKMRDIGKSDWRDGLS